MTDIWVCSTCHSINRQRNSKCYKCGASQAAATGEGSTLRVEQALASRAFVPYRSAWLRGLIASFLILVVAGLGVVLVLLSLDDVAWARGQLDVIVAGGTLDEAAFLERSRESIPIGLARLGALVLAVLFFAAWLSRVIMNIPALGGGVPNATPTKAFIYPLIPLVNLVKVPGMIQDALYRVDPKAGGFFMVALAWFGLVGSWIVGFIAGWAIDIRLIGDAAAATTPAEMTTAFRSAFDLTFAVEVAQWLMVSLGSLLLVAVMLRIERRSRARDREIRAAAQAPQAEAGSVAARPADVAITPVTPDPGPVVAGNGPRLTVTVESDGSMMAEVGGEVEAVTLDDLREAAAALSRAGGSAIVSTTASAADARWAAREAANALRTEGVPTTLAD